MLTYSLPTRHVSEFARCVRECLTKSGQRELPSKYLYDEVGSALFETICVLPEYGLTRADARLLEKHADEIVERLPFPIEVAELGSGSATERHRRAGFGFHFASGLIGRRLTSWRRTVPSPQCSFDRKLVKRCYAQLNSINALWGLLSPRELLVVHSNRHRPRPVWHLRRSEVEVAGWQ